MKNPILNAVFAALTAVAVSPAWAGTTPEAKPEAKPAPTPMAKPAASPEAKPAAAPDAKPADKPASGAKISFTKDTVDLGDVVRGEQAKFTFPFKNVGTADLEIKDVRTSCGCTAANKEQLVGKTFKPGEGTDVVATVNTTNQRGPLSKMITVVSNDGVDAEFKLTAKYNVKALIDVTPSDMVYFPNLYKGEMAGAKQTVNLHADKENAFEIKGDATSSSEFVKATVSKPTKGEDGSVNYTVEVEVAKDMAIGAFSSEVKLKTSHPKVPELSLRVNGQVLGQIIINPLKVFLSRVEKGKTAPITREVNIQKRNATDFKIEKVSSANPAIKVESKEVEAGKSYKLTLTVDVEKLEPGNLNTTITVKTNDKDQPTVEVAVFGTVAAATP